MIQITALGVGGAFTERFYHNNYVFDFGERVLLVDAGTTLRYSLKESEYNITDITDILITHLHSDHIGGLEEFAQRSFFIHKHKPNLWIREDQYGEIKSVLQGLETDGFTLLSYFNVCLFDVSVGFNVYKTKIETIKTDDLHAVGMKSLAFKVTGEKNKTVLFTSDIKRLQVSGIKEMLENDTIIYQDYSKDENAVHTDIKDIKSYYDEQHLQNMYLMHYQDSISDMELNWGHTKEGVLLALQGFTNYIE